MQRVNIMPKIGLLEAGVPRNDLGPSPKFFKLGLVKCLLEYQWILKTAMKNNLHSAK